MPVPNEKNKDPPKTPEATCQPPAPSAVLICPEVPTEELPPPPPGVNHSKEEPPAATRIACPTAPNPLNPPIPRATVELKLVTVIGATPPIVLNSKLLPETPPKMVPASPPIL